VAREEAERAKLEAERIREEQEERTRLEVEAAASARAEVESGAAVRDRGEQERTERLAVAEATARKRREEKARKAAEVRRRRSTEPEDVAAAAAPAPIPEPVVAEPPAAPVTATDDPFAEFREAHDAPTGILRFMPVAGWARTAGSQAAAPAEPPGDVHHDLQALLEGLSVPPEVAVVTYPRGCRIRRVRVRTPQAPDLTARQAVILSRSALQHSRRTSNPPDGA